MLVKQVLGHLVVVCVHLGEVGDVVSQLLDGLHLLIQVVGLQEVTQLEGNTQRTGIRHESYKHHTFRYFCDHLKQFDSRYLHVGLPYQKPPCGGREGPG